MADLLPLPEDCGGWSVMRESRTAWKLVTPAGLVERWPVFVSHADAEATIRKRMADRRRAKESRGLRGGL